MLFVRPCFHPKKPKLRHNWKVPSFCKARPGVSVHNSNALSFLLCFMIKLCICHLKNQLNLTLEKDFKLYNQDVMQPGI